MANEDLFFSEIKTTSTDKELTQLNHSNHLKESEKEVVQEEIQRVPIVEETISHIQSTVNVSNTRPKRELPKSSSIGNMLKDIHQDVAVKNTIPKINLTEVTVQLLWKEFINENKNKLQSAFLSVAEKQIPSLVEHQIVFTESNNISLELLQLHKLDIVSFYLQRTTTSMVELKFELEKKNIVVKSYKTPKDRLKDMIESNPAVLQLIKKFELTLD